MGGISAVSTDTSVAAYHDCDFPLHVTPDALVLKSDALQAVLRVTSVICPVPRVNRML